eukprot:m.201778 g.201778  ORF g.201778 m.201778 type:complete len:428 (-) comp18427_c0_seq4:111-1394(-)
MPPKQRAKRDVCRHCGRMCDVEVLERHQRTCRRAQQGSTRRPATAPPEAESPQRRVSFHKDGAPPASATRSRESGGVRSRGGGLAPGLICPICGRQFGTKSLEIHQPQCIEKWKRENARLPRHLRRAEPVSISSKELQTTSREELQALAWDQAQSQLVPCAHCGRTFAPDRLRVHQRSCTEDSPHKRPSTAAAANGSQARQRVTQAGAGKTGRSVDNTRAAAGGLSSAVDRHASGRLLSATRNFRTSTGQLTRAMEGGDDEDPCRKSGQGKPRAGVALDDRTERGGTRPLAQSTRVEAASDDGHVDVDVDTDVVGQPRVLAATKPQGTSTAAATLSPGSDGLDTQRLRSSAASPRTQHRSLPSLQWAKPQLVQPTRTCHGCQLEGSGKFCSECREKMDGAWHVVVSGPSAVRLQVPLAAASHADAAP